MASFFKSPRRKIGVLTLMQACVLMLGWFRSLFIQDEFTVVLSDRFHIHLLSVNGYLVLLIMNDKPYLPHFWKSRQIDYQGWRTRTGDFEYWTGNLTGRWEYGIPQLHDLMIVIPLALLSAWLLLSKTRVEKTSISKRVLSNASI